MARFVFDLDGTLIDSVFDIAAAANATLADPKLSNCPHRIERVPINEVSLKRNSWSG